LTSTISMNYNRMTQWKITTTTCILILSFSWKLHSNMILHSWQCNLSNCGDLIIRTFSEPNKGVVFGGLASIIVLNIHRHCYHLEWISCKSSSWLIQRERFVDTLELTSSKVHQYGINDSWIHYGMNLLLKVHHSTSTIHGYISQA
jgi:hypothetical protein